MLLKQKKNQMVELAFCSEDHCQRSKRALCAEKLVLKDMLMIF